MGDVWIIKKHTKKWCILCIPFFSILEDAPNSLFLFNSKFYVQVPHNINIVYTHIRTYMHIYICVYTCICAYLGGETHTWNKSQFVVIHSTNIYIYICIYI